MSVFIKCMEMPKRCFECIFLTTVPNFFCLAGKKDLCAEHGINISRPDWCPLIEVPTPHGELVDRNGLMDTYADRLAAVAERYSPDSSECGILSGAMKLLAIQPTVIEAEE